MECCPVARLGREDLPGLFGREISILLAGINSYFPMSEIRIYLPAPPIGTGLEPGRFPPAGITHQ